MQAAQCDFACRCETAHLLHCGSLACFRPAGATSPTYLAVQKGIVYLRPSLCASSRAHYVEDCLRVFERLITTLLLETLAGGLQRRASTLHPTALVFLFLSDRSLAPL